MNAVRLWFAGRSLRERRLVLGAGALALVTLFWGGVVRPLGDVSARARERQTDAVLRLATTRTAVEAIRAAQAGRDTTRTGSLADRVRVSADQAGFTLASLDPAGPGRVRTGIASAKGGALVGWLARLEQSGVLVETVQMTDHGDHTVGVDLTLKAKGR